ncbi:MAG: lipoprotein [Gammaproteobacteria bacterium]
MRFSLYRLILVILLLASLSACGQKGDLFLPGNDTDKTEDR